jgi:hypothetical protein
MEVDSSFDTLLAGVIGWIAGKRIWRSLVRPACPAKRGKQTL